MQLELQTKSDSLKATLLPTKYLNQWEKTLMFSPSYPEDMYQHNQSVREEQGSNANTTDYEQYCTHKTNVFSSVFHTEKQGWTACDFTKSQKESS